MADRNFKINLKQNTTNKTVDIYISQEALEPKGALNVEFTLSDRTIYLNGEGMVELSLEFLPGRWWDYTEEYVKVIMNGTVYNDDEQLGEFGKTILVTKGGDNKYRSSTIELGPYDFGENYITGSPTITPKAHIGRCDVTMKDGETLPLSNKVEGWYDINVVR